MKKTFLPVLFLLAIYAAVAQTLPSGPQVLTFFSEADDTEQPYGLYIPPNYNATKKYPLVIMLHGAGSNHRLALRRVFGKSNANGETDVEASRYFPEWKDVDYIVATPYARGTAGYQGIPEKDVYDVLHDVKKRFSIDEDRVYLTGLSMGGGGTLWMGMTRPDVWAALAPVCPAPPQETYALLANGLNLPTHFFHGDADPVVRVSISRDWVKRLKEIGGKAEYAEYPNVQHDSWVPAYKNGYIFDWFSNFKRNNFPDKVIFNTYTYQYNKAYWVTIDALTPGTLATVEATVSSPNKLDVKTTHVSGFTLRLKGHPKISANQLLELTINGKKIKTTAGESLSFRLENNTWAQGTATPAGKRPGAEGPLRAAFADRHVYVYGTGGNPSPEEMKKRMDIATEAANWSVYRGAFLGRIMFFPRVISDKDVRESDYESSNLILFGTKETNAVIAKLAGQLPLHLNTSEKQYGLFYIFPVNGKYVVVNSGLPWWTGVQVQGYPFLPQPYLALNTFKDFVIFKDSAKEVIAEGYFDQQWKLPADLEKQVYGTGAVSLSAGGR